MLISSNSEHRDRCRERSRMNEKMKDMKIYDVHNTMMSELIKRLDIIARFMKQMLLMTSVVT